MKLYTYCVNCKSEINLLTNATDRFVLARKKGERIKLNCSTCETSNDYHVNDLKAEEGKTLGIIAIFILFGGTTVVLIYLWPYIFQLTSVYAISGSVGILTIPFLVFQAINSGKEMRVRYFNSKRYG